MGQLAEHPKGSTVCIDQQGSYVAFHKLCNTCSIELTSRNRAPGGNLRCRGCTATRAKRGWTGTEGGGDASQRLDKPMPVKPVPPNHSGNPSWQKIRSLLTEFLLYPKAKGTKDELLAALVDYEIKDRFRFL
jgi:hypothetical protein